MDPYIQHGSPNLALPDQRFAQRSRELDTIAISFQDESASVYPVGSIIADYPGMPIVERERNKEGPVYQYRLQLEGIADPAQLYVETDYSESSPEEGFDEIRRSIITQQPAHAWFIKGAQLRSALTNLVVPGYENMYVVDRDQHKHRAAGYYQVGLALKGMLGTKVAKRRINTSGQAVSARVQSGLSIVSPIYIGYPPVLIADGDAILHTVAGQQLEYDIPGISVSDSILTTVEPPNVMIGQFWNPANPPTLGGINVLGEAYTYHIPWGWKCTSLQSEKLVGAGVWFVNITWAYQRATTARDADPVPP